VFRRKTWRRLRAERTQQTGASSSSRRRWPSWRPGEREKLVSITCVMGSDEVRKLYKISDFSRCNFSIFYKWAH